MAGRLRVCLVLLVLAACNYDGPETIDGKFFDMVVDGGVDGGVPDPCALTELRAALNNNEQTAKAQIIAAFNDDRYQTRECATQLVIAHAKMDYPLALENTITELTTLPDAPEVVFRAQSVVPHFPSPLEADLDVDYTYNDAGDLIGAQATAIGNLVKYCEINLTYLVTLEPFQPIFQGTSQSPAVTDSLGQGELTLDSSRVTATVTIPEQNQGRIREEVTCYRANGKSAYHSALVTHDGVAMANDDDPIIYDPPPPLDGVGVPPVGSQHSSPGAGYNLIQD